MSNVDTKCIILKVILTKDKNDDNDIYIIDINLDKEASYINGNCYEDVENLTRDYISRLNDIIDINTE